MTAIGIDDARERLARVALRQCQAWCRRRSGSGRRWRQRLDPDWEQVAVLAAFQATRGCRITPGYTHPHPNFIAACCRGALSQLTATSRRRAASGGFDFATAPRVALDPDVPSPASGEPWVGAIVDEEARPPRAGG